MTRGHLAVRLLALFALVVSLLGSVAVGASAATTGSIVGSVTSPQGPLSGSVSISAYRWDEESSAWEHDGLYRYQSASAFTVANLAPGRYKLRFGDPALRSPHLPTFHPSSLTLEDATPIEVRAGETTVIDGSVLRVGGTISGTVELPAGVVSDGSPMVSAQVRNEDGSLQSVGSGHVDRATGDYTIVGLPDDDYLVRFGDTTYGVTDEYYDGELMPELATKVAIRDAGTVTGIDATLDPYASLLGTVRDQYGDPAHARVVLYRWEPAVQRWRHHSTMKTKERSGRYELIMVPPGEYRLRYELLEKPEVAAVFNGGATAFEDAPRLEFAGTTAIAGLDAQFGTGLEVSGAIRLPGGGPADATVSVLEWDDYRQTWVTLRQAVTSEGRYRIGGLHRGSFLVRVDPDDAGLRTQFHDGSLSADAADRLTLNASVADVDVRLREDEATGTIRGTVAGLEDRPFVGTVRALAMPEGTEAATTTLGRDGAYALRGLVPGTYAVRFDAAATSGLVDEYYDDVASAAASTTIEVGPNETISEIDAVLAGDPTTGGVAGRITGPDGVPVAGAVRVWRPGDLSNFSVRTRTDPQTGAYRVWGLPPGAYQIQSDPDHPRMRELSYGEAGSETVDVEADRLLSGLDIALDCSGPCAGSPTVSGIARVGETLTVDPGVWLPAATTFRYQWFQVATGRRIPGATGPTYTLTSEDVGQRMWVEVTGTADGKSSGAHGVLMPYVTQGVSSAGTVELAGVPAVGRTIEAKPRGWTPAHATFSFTWLRNGVAIDAQRTSRMTFAPADLDAEFAVRVTATAAGYPSTTTTSAPVRVARGAVTAGRVGITGDERLGGRLTAKPVAWPSAATFGYQWLRSGTPIAGATGATYRPTERDLARRLSVRVTGSLPAHASATATSAATSVVRSPARLAVSAKRGKRRATLTVRAHAAAVRPTGVVRVRVDGKVRASARLKGGRATLTVKGLRPGRHRFAIEYAGDRKVTPATVRRTLRIS